MIRAGTMHNIVAEAVCFRVAVCCRIIINKIFVYLNYIVIRVRAFLIIEGKNKIKTA